MPSAVASLFELQDSDRVSPLEKFLQRDEPVFKLIGIIGRIAGARATVAQRAVPGGSIAAQSMVH